MDNHMDMGSDTPATATGMAMSMMSNAFFTSTRTSLYSTAWTPASTSGYVGICIFLIFLAAIFRGLLACKILLEQRWIDREFQRRYVSVKGEGRLSDAMSADQEMGKERWTLSARGVEEGVVLVGNKHGVVVRPWRLSVDPLRAAADTVVVGVGYLLMLAVMTFNVGYFLSVLGGTFLGSLAVGRYAVRVEH